MTRGDWIAIGVGTVICVALLTIFAWTTSLRPQTSEMRCSWQDANTWICTETKR